MDAPLIVSLEGLPGSGKTTTASLLADRLGISYLHERSAEVPFLEAFYSDVERYKLETELCFVLIHYHQYRDIRDPTVLDYSPAKDVVFADLNLDASDHELFDTVYSRTSGSLPIPAQTVFLDLDQGHLLERIAARDRPFERGFDEAYLAELTRAYEARMSDLGEHVLRVSVTRADSPSEVVDRVYRTLQEDGAKPP